MFLRRSRTMAGGLLAWTAFLASAAPGGCAAGKGDNGAPDARQPGEQGTGGSPLDPTEYIPGLLPIEPDCEGEYEITIRSGTNHYARDKSRELPEECVEEIVWTDPEVPLEPVTPPPPAEETFECPPDYSRVHVRDVWSSQSSPSLNRFDELPAAVLLVDTTGQIATNSSYGARQESVSCDWYSVCLAPDLTTFGLNAIGPGECADGGGVSGNLSLGDAAGAGEIWIDYAGSNLAGASGDGADGDYGYYGSTAQHFRITTDRADVEHCAPGAPPAETPAGYTKVHVRWPWGDPTVTGYPGTACGERLLGVPVPPYPTSLQIKVGGGTCLLTATLEFQNGHCPWYSVLVPNDQWQGNFQVVLGQEGASTLTSPPNVELPERTQDEYWFAYIGGPDDLAFQGTACNNFSNRASLYQFFTESPGPGYENCGGTGEVTADPCRPPVPEGYHTVHIRHLWAGQKTFTFFPRPEFMPAWLLFEVNTNQGDDYTDIICYREADRPWYSCPVPDYKFTGTTTWRMVDKTHATEWNTVEPRDNFPTEPGEYWLRWNYGKPDIPLGPTMVEQAANGELRNPEQFRFYDYYPDGTGGDWSATGAWGDEECAAKPPPTAPEVGFDGWFPYDETGYAYPFGSSLARTYPKADEVQVLLNSFVQERYEMWRDKYVEFGTECGGDTARVKTNIGMTVSEGQGYGIAVAAAIGDKSTFDQLWRFTRHFLSQSANKYCGGLMGWNYEGTCRELDQSAPPGESGGNDDSAFDGDVDIGIGLVFAALQWPEYVEAAAGWLQKMECEINTVYDGQFYYPAPGDTWNKNCQGYPGEPCSYTPGQVGDVNVGYNPPGYFRVFGDFLATHLDPAQYDEGQRQYHREFWHRTAETVYELYERCYDNPNVHPALAEDFGFYDDPCGRAVDNYNWARTLWRVSVDAAWFGHRTDLPETVPGSSQHYPGKSRMQAKIENIQDYFTDFHLANPPEPNANRFSTICRDLNPSGVVSNCDPAYDHNSYFVNTALTSFVPAWDNEGKTTPTIRREALEESVSASVMNDRYYQESLGVYTLLFLTGNFPNPLEVE